MIDKVIVAKIIGGGLATTGVVGGGYYANHSGYLNFEFSTEEKEDIKDYLIVKSVEHTSDLNENIYEKSIFGNLTKNFKCELKISTSKTDNECEIYKLSDSEKSLATAINNNLGATKSNIQVANNFFKLKVSNDLINSITKWDDQNEIIEINQKEVSANSKVFGKFIPIYKVKGGKITKRKNSSLFAKVIESTGTSVTQPDNEITESTKNYQCEITNGSKKEKFDCNIKEIEFKATEKTVIFKQDNTTDPVTINATKNNLKAKDKHYQIVMTEEHLNKITFENGTQTIDIVEKTNSTENKKYASLTPQFKVLDSSTKTLNAYSLALLVTGEIGDETDALEENCSVNGENIGCEIYKFATPQAKATGLSSLNFSSSLTKITTASEIKTNKDNYLVIKLKEKSDFLKKETEIHIKNKAEPSKTYSFSSKQNIFVDLETNNQVVGTYIFE